MKRVAKKTQVSLRGATYARLKKYCEENGLAVSNLVDDLCAAFFANGEKDAKRIGDKPGGNGKDKPSKGKGKLADDDHRKVRF